MFQFLIGRLATNRADAARDEADMFQFLIGRLATSCSYLRSWGREWFQFLIGSGNQQPGDATAGSEGFHLIGRLATQAVEIETDSAYTFQFLIGRLATSKAEELALKNFSFTS